VIKKRRKTFIFILSLFIFVMIFVVYYMMIPQPTNAMMVGFSNMLRYDNKVYMEKNITAETRDNLYKDFEHSKTRLLEFFEEIKSSPTIIFVQSPKALKSYAQNQTGQTYYMYWGNYIVIGPNGFNEDVIAHELMHSELRERIKKHNVIPVWFDEGLATLVDNRISKVNQRNIDFDTLNTHSAFHDPIRSKRNYGIAKYEVDRWYKIVGKIGLNYLINGLNNGETFKDLYEKIENNNAGISTKR
jgi:hypothetical protein